MSTNSQYSFCISGLPETRIPNSSRLTVTSLGGSDVKTYLTLMNNEGEITGRAKTQTGQGCWLKRDGYEERELEDRSTCTVDKNGVLHVTECGLKVDVGDWWKALGQAGGQ
jgi:hypothetical protein